MKATMEQKNNGMEYKKEKENWLLESVSLSLDWFYKLPNNAILSLILMNLEFKDLCHIAQVSKSFSQVIAKYKLTKIAHKNFEEFLWFKLKKLAGKQNIELNNDILMPEAILAVQQGVEIKRNSLILRTQNRQSNIYEKACNAICCICSGGAYSVTLSPGAVKFMRILFLLLFVGSALGLYRGISLGKDDPNTYDAYGTCALTLGITGLTLLIDIGYSIYKCILQREADDQKSQLSFLQNMSSINNENKLSENVSNDTSVYVALSNGD